MFSLFLFVCCFGWSAAAPATGSCLCVHGTHVNVRDAAGLHGDMVAAVSTGECYKFNGGVLTKDDHTWYELQDVHGHHRAWIASSFVKTSASSFCTSSGSSSSGGFFSTGHVSHHCMQCLCTQESGCRPIGCHVDVNFESCGYFKINAGYWSDCGSPGGSWHACTKDKHCASQCVQAYMKRYASRSGCAMNCETYARIHNGGPTGCKHSSTLEYWSRVKSHSGCNGL